MEKILIIGNSHSNDAFWQLFEVFKAQAPEQKVLIGILYYSGCQLARHVEFAQQEAEDSLTDRVIHGGIQGVAQTVGTHLAVGHLVGGVLPDLAEEESVERAYLRQEQKITLHRAMRQLKDEYRRVLYLTYFEGFTNSETAYAMKKSNRQIENLIYRAKQSLRIQLEKENFVYEEL